MPVNGNGPAAAGVRGGVHGPSPIPASMATPPNGVGPVPVAVLAPNECPPGPPYHPLHPPPTVHQGQPGGPMVAVAPMPAHHHNSHMATSTAAAIRHPLHLHTNPPHICQLHINGGGGEGECEIFAVLGDGFGTNSRVSSPPIAR